MRATRAISTSMGTRIAGAAGLMNRTKPARVRPAFADAGTPTVRTTTPPGPTLPLVGPSSDTPPRLTTSYATVAAAPSSDGSVTDTTLNDRGVAPETTTLRVSRSSPGSARRVVSTTARDARLAVV